MDDLLNDDMSAAIDSLDLSLTDKELITSVLFEERNHKERDWIDDAVKSIVLKLERLESGHDIV